jgi:hypothetical protein
VDIFLTAVDLCADNGFIYHSFGKNILGKNSLHEGSIADAVVFAGRICDARDLSIHDVPGVPLPDDSKAKVSEVVKRQKALFDLSRCGILIGDKVEGVPIKK